MYLRPQRTGPSVPGSETSCLEEPSVNVLAAAGGTCEERGWGEHEEDRRDSLCDRAEHAKALSNFQQCQPVLPHPILERSDDERQPNTNCPLSYERISQFPVYMHQRRRAVSSRTGKEMSAPAATLETLRTSL